MFKKLLRALSISLALVMLLALVACGGSTSASTASTQEASSAPAAPASSEASTKAAEPVTLKVYAQYADDDTKVPWDYAIAALKKDMPNVTIELDIQAQDGNQKLKTYNAAGNLPDIFQSSTEIINLFKESKTILQLDQYAESTGFKAKMIPSNMPLLVGDDGHIWAFPYAGNELVLFYYNKELFSQNSVKVPTTIDELKTAVAAFKSKGIIPMSIFAKETWPCVALFDMFATRMDPAGITKLDKGTASASDPAYKFAAQTVYDLVNAGLVQKGATNTNYDQAAALFYQGKAAMFLNGQWFITDATKNMGDKADWAYYPASDAAQYESAKLSFSGSGGPGGYSVAATSENKDVAAQVAAYLSLKYAECKYTQRGTPIVATKVDATPAVPFPAMMQKLATDIPNIKSYSAFEWYLNNPKFKVPFAEACQKLVTGGYTPDQFAKDVDKAIADAKQ